MKALVVEDELIVAMDLESRFVSLGIEVVDTCQNYDKALQIYYSTEIDTIFLDINIQGNQSGLDIAKKIRETNPSIKIVFITAFSNSKVMEQIDEVKSSGYIKKPIDDDSLKEVVDRLMN